MAGARKRRMRSAVRTCVVLAAVGLGGWATDAAAQAVDRVRLLDRGEVTGKITGTTPDAVEIEDARSGEPKKVPIETIRDVLIGDEPDVLRNARGMLQRRDGARATAELANLTAQDTDGASPLVLAELDFVRAGAAALGAMAAGTGQDAASAYLPVCPSRSPSSSHAS